MKPESTRRTNLYEVVMGRETWHILSLSYAEVLNYVDLVFRSESLPQLVMKRIDYPYVYILDDEVLNEPVLTNLYMATYRGDDDGEEEVQILTNNISTLLKSVDESYIVSIMLYAPRAVVLSDVGLGTTVNKEE